MSTNYYALKPPVTHVTADEAGVHVRVKVWVNHALTGQLTVRKSELKDFLLVLADREDPAARTWHGGAEKGLQAEVLGTDLPAYTTLVSEDGELMTLAELTEKLGGSNVLIAPTSPT